MILHDRKLIYIHVPKTGGRSVESAFSFEIQPRMPIDDPFGIHTVDKETEKHLPAALLRRSFPDAFSEYFKVGYVRNSWDLILSAYLWLKSGCNLRRDFKEWIMGDFVDTPVRERNIFIKPCQLDWLTDEEGNIIVDLVGRFENLTESFQKVCERIGASDVVLPHLNQTEHGHYSRYYDTQTQKRIATLYRKDIDYFGFEFESR